MTNEDQIIHVFPENIHDVNSHENLKKTENGYIRGQMEKIKLLTFRIEECKTENQMLEKNLSFIKELIFKEIGSNSSNLQELLKPGKEFEKRERIENVFLLKNGVEEIQNYLNQLEDDSATAHKLATEEYFNKQLLAERKAFWRMELERRLANEDIEREINLILREKNELNERLKSEKQRLSELKEEVHLLRGEIDLQMDKKEKTETIANFYQNIENQLQKTLLERREIRQELLDSRTRNERLEHEISELKEKSQALDDKINDNNALIFSYVAKKKKIQEAIEKRSIFFQNHLDCYTSQLEKFEVRYNEDLVVIDSVRKLVLEKHQILSDIDKGIGNFANIKESKEEKSEVFSKNKFSSHRESRKPSLNDNSKEMAVNEVQEKNTNNSNEKFEMFMDWLKYKCLLETAEHQKELLSFIMQEQKKQISEFGKQKNQVKKEIKKKTRQKNALSKKLSNCRELLSKKKRDLSLKSKNELEELQIKIKVQKEANTFLRNLFEAIFEMRTKNFVQYKDFVINRKEFYFNTSSDIYSIIEDKKNQSLEIN